MLLMFVIITCPVLQKTGTFILHRFFDKVIIEKVRAFRI